ncbi:MAG TPA: glycosyltransferase family 4 protein [Thermoleophilaceae bacterium]|nr:glycosyltransferase family 4 protein [Thermoleophilaceae bacterium]
MGQRVLILSWEYPPIVEGGLARHVRKLAEGLVSQGAEVHVLTRGGGNRPPEENRHGVIVHRVAEPDFPKDDLNAFIAWVGDMNSDLAAAGERLGERIEFDLVHSHDWLVASAAEQLKERFGTPWLVTVHATEHGRHQGWVRKHPQSYIHRVERRMVRTADRVITCSDFVRGHVNQVFRVAKRKITTIPNGIDPLDLEPIEAVDLEQLRARYAAPGERLILLVGRLVYEKGFHLALEALPQTIKQLGNVRFVVCGTGTAEADLKDQARELGLTRRGAFIGWTGDDTLHSLYRVADLCVIPSIYEPFGLVALEAMASGCLTLVADTGGLREVVPEDGTAGLRFRARDPRSLARMIEKMLTDEELRERLVAEAREHVLKFDWAEVARETAQVYDELVAAGSVARAT